MVQLQNKVINFDREQTIYITLKQLEHNEIIKQLQLQLFFLRKPMRSKNNEIFRWGRKRQPRKSSISKKKSQMQPLNSMRAEKPERAYIA